MRAGHLLAGALGLAAALPALAGGRDLLFWAPYGTGSSEQAAETMTAFARYLEKAAGWPEGSAGASYLNEVGDASTAGDDPAFLVVTAPVFLQHHRSRTWRPLLTLVTDSADAQRYTLYGPKGATLESLRGAPLVGDSAYDPTFVAGLVLGTDGSAMPYELEPTARPLSAVRRAARGERVLVLLDESQRQALAALPTPVELEVLAESPWMPAGILVATPSADASDADALAAALKGAADDPSAAELLKTMKIRRFDPIADDQMTTLAKTYDAARAPAEAG